MFTYEKEPRKIRRELASASPVKLAFHLERKGIDACMYKRQHGRVV